LRYWIHRLCPDRPAMPLTIIVQAFGQGALTDAYGHGGVHVDTMHWLTAWAMAEGARDPKVLAWLLLGVYAGVNAALEDITNDHERAFQAELAQALTNGELCMLRAPARATPPAWPMTDVE
jgi:hypothetical protein